VSDTDQKKTAASADACARDTGGAVLKGWTSPKLQAFLVTFVIMMLIWVIFSGMFDAFHLTLGVISCFLVAFFSSDLLFEGGCSCKTVCINWPKFIAYVPWLLWEVIKANVWLMYLVFHPRMKEMIDPRIIKFRTRLDDRMARLTLANSITLTPGTITVYAGENGVMTIHAIDQKTAEPLMKQGEIEMEDKVAKAFGVE
jgi:multicomponent Na+:H+ antiporter subunit E